MDEGFNTYSTTKVMDQVFNGIGELPVKLMGVDLWKLLRFPGVSDRTLNRSQFLVFPAGDNMLRPAWQYYNSTSYGINSYFKMGVTLDTLEAYLGQDTMARVMRTYHQRWRFRHPTSQDFIAVVNEVTGRDWRWYFDQVWYGSDLCDYAVSSVKSEHPPRAEGYVEGDQGRLTYVRPAEKGQPAAYDSVVEVRRLGGVRIPVDVLVQFARASSAWTSPKSTSG